MIIVNKRGERLSVVGGTFDTYTDESGQGRYFKDYGDGRLYEYADNGSTLEDVWTFIDEDDDDETIRDRFKYL